jgi:6-phosphogluconolactonase (cycloisomerase 2 family)
LDAKLEHSKTAKNKQELKRLARLIKQLKLENILASQEYSKVERSYGTRHIIFKNFYKFKFKNSYWNQAYILVKAAYTRKVDNWKLLKKTQKEFKELFNESYSKLYR